MQLDIISREVARMRHVWIVVVLIVVIAFIWFYQFNIDLTDCSIAKHRESTSSDGRFVATIWKSDCGATTAVGLVLTVEEQIPSKMERSSIVLSANFDSSAFVDWSEGRLVLSSNIDKINFYKEHILLNGTDIEIVLNNLASSNSLD